MYQQSGWSIQGENIFAQFSFEVSCIKIVIYQKNMSKGTESEEKDQEDDDEDVCPNCKKKGKNILLHIKKSNECKTAVGKEDLIRLKDKSEKKRREKKQIYWKLKQNIITTTYHRED